MCSASRVGSETGDGASAAREDRRGQINQRHMTDDRSGLQPAGDQRLAPQGVRQRAFLSREVGERD